MKVCAFSTLIKKINPFFFFSLLCLAHPEFCLAAEWAENFQYHGFLSQGYVLTSDNNFYGSSQGSGSLDFTEIGANASVRPSPRFGLAAQVLFRRAGRVDDNTFNLDYALMDFTALSRENGRLGMRLGRVKNLIGLYNDTRDVAFTRPSIFLPQGIYFDRSRSLFLSSDGGQLFAEYRHPLGDFFFHWNVGLPRNINKELEIAVLRSNRPGELDSQLSYFSQLRYERNGGQVILALSYANALLNYDPGRNDILRDGSLRFEPIIFSAQYNGERFSLTGEYLIQPNTFKNFGPAFPDLSPTSESWYLQGSYRILPQLQAILRYDEHYIDRDDRNGKRFEKMGLPDHAAFAKDWMFGISWDITSSWMVRAEYHRIHGTSWLPAQDNPDPSKTEQDWDMFALLLSFRF